MHPNYTGFFLDLKDDNVRITNTSKIDDTMSIDISFSQGYHACPNCSLKTSKVHDYRIRKIKHGFINGYHITLNYKRRRYVCKSCHTRFPEPNSFIAKYAKISHLNKKLIIHEAKSLSNFKTIASKLNISSSTVIRHIDNHIKPNKLTLSEIISFDEFKNTKSGDTKYAFLIVNPIDKKIIDIVKSRRSNHLNAYFSSIPLEDRLSVKKVIIDLWSPYKAIIKRFFPNALIIADNFHFSRYIYWAFNDVRIRIMNSFPIQSESYRMLKRYWKVLSKNSSDLSNDLKLNPITKTHLSALGIQDYASNLDPDLEDAMKIKDFFLKKSKDLDVNAVDSFFDEFILMLEKSSNKEFRDIKKTFVNWKKEIKHSFSIRNTDNKRYSNGVIEGINNYIKVIKRISFGYRSFDRFRNRIMYLFNKDYSIVG